MFNHSNIKSSIMSLISILLLIALIVYAFINAYLYFFQRSLLYLPAKHMLDPKHYGLYNMEELKLKTADNVKITAWYRPSVDKEPVIVYLHGNAGNLGDRTEKFQSLLNKDFGVLAVSWRGYGSSEGSPTEEGLYEDARAAIKYLLDKDYKLEDIVVYGESLGSGVAVQMATENNFKSVILEAPYTSIANRAAELYPYIAVKLLLKDKFDSIAKIKNVKSPTLIYHGYRDEVMPIEHGRRILEAANEPKEARFFDNVGHTDFDLEKIADITYEFVSKSN